jgi:hypothetical protein
MASDQGSFIWTFLFQIWRLPDGFATFLVALATLLAGSFVIGAAILAWRSVQQQIHSAENIEKTRRDHEITAVEIGFKAELLVYSRAVIEATSKWNLRASQPNSFPQNWEITEWPIFTDPLYYKESIGKIGVIREQWVGGALIGFYGNLLELNDQSRESLAGRPTHDVTSQSIAARLQLMAANLSQALDGLNADRKIGIPSDIKVELLCDPNGKWLCESADLPKNLQDVLLKLAQ